jgi:multiple antibiotic resistance protein
MSWDSDSFTHSFLLLFVLLNPFIMSVYLLDLVKTLDISQFAGQLVRGSLISLVVFLLFARAGEAIFQDVMQVHFASFLIFGGITFLIIGIRLILGVGPPVELLHPKSGQVSASIAMPLIVGPGTISASVLAGSRLSFLAAALVIVLALSTSVAAILLIKMLFDFVRTHNEPLVNRYAEIAGRATALFTGSFAIEMIFLGVERWIAVIGASAPG